jgi:hypothetical protein
VIILWVGFLSVAKPDVESAPARAF